MKVCITCNIKKPIEDYYAHPQMADGHLNKCKECVKEYQRKRPTNKEYEKRRNKLPHRVAAKAAYQKTEAGKEALAKSRANFRKRYPKKYKAINTVNNAVRDGKLEKQPCEICGETKRIHGHHDDYDKPLEVRWLCNIHHKQWHAENGEGRNGR